MSKRNAGRNSSEWLFAEQPTLEYLEKLGYEYIDPSKHSSLRKSNNQVIFLPHLITALQKLNDISETDAKAAASELLDQTDNEKWLKYLRGGLARKVDGERTSKTLHLLDFQNINKNHFAVTRQLYVRAEKPHRADIVVYANGIPIVVIETKSPLNAKDKIGEAFEQIKQYERDIPHLFYSNLFNIITNGINLLYGATGASSKFYSYWRDEYKQKNTENLANELERGLWGSLEPSRLLDIIAHFIVFERDAEAGKTIKKICRYQQFRAVNKMVERVVEGKHKQGLIWHTQGSGKSLTMVFAALKLKHHLNISSTNLQNPNLLVLTDRVDLDQQIARTFRATKLPNPHRVDSINELREKIASNTVGQTLISTIHKFEGSSQAIPNSQNWIVMVDECHRTQEKDLGLALRKTLPEATFFGFTGTPIKKDDKNTYQNFGAEDEDYLDKYSIENSISDNATVPIYYTARKTEWLLDAEKIDVMFDKSFDDLNHAEKEQVKNQRVSIANLIKHHDRIEQVAYDIWQHFKGYALKDGFKAQLVAYDREAIVLYKRALDKLITDEYIEQGMEKTEAQDAATKISACVYSSTQKDSMPSENKYKEEIRVELEKWYANSTEEARIKDEFRKLRKNPQILIICEKLLTGFDAPNEAVMYLDKPLKEHSLLQAIARTNRVTDDKKKNGLIVDYIGVSQKLDEALASYHSKDVKNAMHDLENLRVEFREAHSAVLHYVKNIQRKNGEKDIKNEYYALVKSIGTEDNWLRFQSKVRAFIKLYQALAPDVSVWEATDDLKWFAGFLWHGKQMFEKKEYFEQENYSAKITAMINEYLEVTGIKNIIELRAVIDEQFWLNFDTTDKTEADIKTAALQKTTELRKITKARIQENHHQYEKFSEKLRELIKKMDDTQLSWMDKLEEAKKYAQEIDAEKNAHEGSGLSKNAYAILMVVDNVNKNQNSNSENKHRELALQVERLYTYKMLTPTGWQGRESLRKKLRQKVREVAHNLGFTLLEKLPVEIEDIAIKQFAK